MSGKKNWELDALNQREELLGGFSETGSDFQKGRTLGRSPYLDSQPQDYDDFKQIQKNQEDETDQLLSMLGQGVKGVKQLAIGIGKEADSHNEIIDDISDKTDKSNVKIKNTTKRIDRLQLKSDVCGMWICILVLVLTLIGVLVAAFELPS